MAGDRDMQHVVCLVSFVAKKFWEGGINSGLYWTIIRVKNKIKKNIFGNLI